MTYKKIALFLFIAACIALPTTRLRAQADETEAAQEAMREQRESARQRQAEQLEGTWVTEVIPQAPAGAQPFRIYRTFARGGVMFISDRSRPLDGLQHGVWEHRGGNNFTWGVVQDRFDAAGTFVGTFTAHVDARLTGPDSLTSVTSVEFRDTAGNLTLSRCSTATARHFKIPDLPLQCGAVPR